MKGTVAFGGSKSDSFSIRSSGVKQGCVLALTLFDIFFAMTLKHAFGNAAEGIYLRTRSDRKLFNISRLKAKSKVHHRCLRDFLFADGADVIAHSAKDLQRLMDRFSQACKDFGLTISLKKTQIMAQGIDLRPHVTVLNHELDVAYDFVYLRSAISDSLFSEHRAPEKDRQSVYNHGQTGKTSMDQQQSVRTYSQTSVIEHNPFEKVCSKSDLFEIQNLQLM